MGDRRMVAGSETQQGAHFDSSVETQKWRHLCLALGGLLFPWSRVGQGEGLCLRCSQIRGLFPALTCCLTLGKASLPPLFVLPA